MVMPYSLTTSGSIVIDESVTILIFAIYFYTLPKNVLLSLYQKTRGFAVKDIHSCFLSRLRQKNLYYEGHGHGQCLDHPRAIHGGLLQRQRPHRRPFFDLKSKDFRYRLAH